jgi:hypothetical protein
LIEVLLPKFAMEPTTSGQTCLETAPASNETAEEIYVHQ